LSSTSPRSPSLSLRKRHDRQLKHSARQRGPLERASCSSQITVLHAERRNNIKRFANDDENPTVTGIATGFATPNVVLTF
jgi:hypothetical protein